MATKTCEVPAEQLAIIGNLGFVTPLGNDEATFKRRLFNGENGIQRRKFPEYPHARVRVMGTVENFDEMEAEDRLAEQGLLDPVNEMGLFSKATLGALEVTRQILEPFTVYVEEDGRRVPRLNPKIFNSDRIGIVIATEAGGTVEESIKTHERIKSTPPKHAEPESIVRGLADTVIGAVTKGYGIHERGSIIGSACASGEDAINYARMMIREPQSEVDAVLVLGTDFSRHIVLSQFNAASALSTRDDSEVTPSAFDEGADGFVMGEGSAGFLLARPELALVHNIPVRAYHIGSAAYNEAYNPTFPLPDGEGTYRVMSKLLDKTVGGIRIEELLRNSEFWIKAHGTDTGGDKLEAKGILRKMRDANLLDPFKGFGSLKGMMGHLLTVAGIVETAASVLALENQLIPPNIKCPNPVPQAEGRVIRQTTPAPIELVINLVNGFGGNQRAGALKRAR